MIYLFYIILAILTINEIIFLFDRKRLNVRFRNKDVEKVKLLDVSVYLFKTISIFWPVIGLFTKFHWLFLLVIVLNIFKFIAYHINNLSYSVYIFILPFIIILIYSFILYRKLF
jgi:hypothetical protein